MPQLRDFLQRFRPAGSPGAARAAVPADRSRELAGELTPVLALLDGTDGECAAIIAESRREAERIIAGARDRAAEISADANTRAGAARDEAALQVVTAVQAQADAAVATARRQATRTRELAARRIPVLTERAIELVRGLGAR